MYEVEDEWILYKDRPEWADVTPIKQDDGPHSVVVIMYREKFADVYNFFRAILKSGEKSERALELTKDALYMNPSNYTVWQYRREILKELDSNLGDELAYSEAMIKLCEKNYQVWHHRRVIVEWLGDASEEGRLTEDFLSSDPKNYHAWQHRQWYIRTFNLYKGELEFAENLIREDVRNNSAWNQRYFVINNTTQFSEDVLQREVEFTLKNIDRVRRNESAWNYLRGSDVDEVITSSNFLWLNHHLIVGTDSILLNAKEDSQVVERVRNYCEQLYSSGERSPYLLGFIVDLCEESIQRKKPTETLNVDRATELCQLLAKEVDRIRCNYWEYMGRAITAKAKKCNEL